MKGEGRYAKGKGRGRYVKRGGGKDGSSSIHLLPLLQTGEVKRDIYTKKKHA